MKTLRKSLIIGIIGFVVLLSGCELSDSGDGSNVSNNSSVSSTANNEVNTLLAPAQEFSQTGTGDKIITGLVANNKYTIIHLTHSGRSNFIVKADEEGTKINYLANKIGVYDGYYLLDENGTFRLDIAADGDWKIEVVQFSRADTNSFSGTGDVVTGVFVTNTDMWGFTYNGSSNFIVKQYSVNSYNLSVNKIGEYSGEGVSTIKKGKASFFVIQAEGDWTISAK